jgi:hypothetical protein
MRHFARPLTTPTTMRFPPPPVCLAVVLLFSSSGCSLLSSLPTRDLGRALTRGNQPFSISLNKVSPPEDANGDLPYAVTDKAYSVSLPDFVINDGVGNDAERSILLSAGIISSNVAYRAATVGGVPISVSNAEFFSDGFQKEVRAAAEAAARETPQKPISATGLADSVFSLVRDSLAAEYTVSAQVTAKSFDLSKGERSFALEKKVKQRHLGNPVTDGKWDALLYRGGGVDVMEVTLGLKRSSAISKELDRQITKLEKSSTFADLLSDLLGSVLGSIGNNIGHSFGERADRALYGYVKKRYGPTFDMGKGSWSLITSATSGTSNIISRPPMDNALFVGKTVLKLTATLDVKSDSSVPLDSRTSDLLSATIEVKPLRQ